MPREAKNLVCPARLGQLDYGRWQGIVKLVLWPPGWLGSAQARLRLGPARLGSARIDRARLGSAQASSVRLGLQICDYVDPAPGMLVIFSPPPRETPINRTVTYIS